MEYKTIALIQKEGVATVTMNRPEALNALGPTLVEELLDCFTRLSLDPGVKVVILTGRGRAFSSGGDLRAMKESEHLDFLLKSLAQVLHNVVATIRRMKKPVIAAINGVTAGGAFPLALACDIVIASEEARFNLAYANIGLCPDGGSTHLVARLLGWQRVCYLTFTGEFIDARKGQEWGFVNQVVKPEELMPTAEALASRLASGPTLALARAKELLNHSLSQGLETQMEEERDGVSTMAATADFQEGLAAFFEKRRPRFQGR